MVDHGDRKYGASQDLGGLDEWDDFCFERRALNAGVHPGATLEYTEVAIVLSGRSSVGRIGNGRRHRAFAQPGTVWICPTGTYEREIEVGDKIECLHVYLPETLVGEAALQGYGVDPARVELAYAGGVVDQPIHQIGMSLVDLLTRDFEPTDRLWVDGMRTALAGRLLNAYSVDRWQAPRQTPSLDHKRLKRVTDYIDAHLANELSLAVLAAEACLSPFHFSRLFSDATGVSPHRYVIDRRVEAAKADLALDRSTLVEIALDLGFGSQDNFSRVFRKKTGLTPGQYRNVCRGA